WHIHAIYPNPFNSEFRISVAGLAGDDFAVTLHNLLGQQVALLHRGRVSSPEIHFVAPPEMATGLYFLHARSRGHSETKKVVFLR
ncbi:T9SS type A sorting domain-containing protein, partial [bacterium]|nr:T9SS type A sorting domain-containing protein [bacterium]